MSEKWACRFCKQKLELRTEDRQSFKHEISHPTSHELQITWTVCPNADCRKPVLIAKLFTTVEGKIADQPVDYWTSLVGRELHPLSRTVPEPLRNDYSEARKILNWSPTACVMLARRCLERVLRDKWKTKGPSLAAQISEIKGKIDLDLWKTLESAREIGNSCAHAAATLQDDPNVTQPEAARLLELLKMLFEDWYPIEEKKEKLFKALDSLAQKHRRLKKAA